MTVVRCDDDRRNRFIAYSQLKYGGIMDAWLGEIDLEIVRCRACDHHWYAQQPEPDQLLAMYNSSRSFFGNVAISREPTDAMRREMRSLRRLVRRTPAPLLLDYGSGYGRWARAASAEGFTVYAYEPSVSRGHEENGGFSVVHRIEDLAGHKFAVINLEQVLEHVPDPMDVLLEVKALCNPGGIVRITVPNLLRCHEGTRIWDEWPFGGKCVHTMAPFEHLHGFTPLSLEQVVVRAGFRLLSPFRTMRSHPALPVRRMARRVWPRLGHTSVLAQVSD
ncbi:MAG TPA: class I SAM-dependent methyltransferase [Vicinamibacterales bacterium]|nr:class I SAM-dependent methyltransferase [Vicinamibacterales bacterium]